MGSFPPPFLDFKNQKTPLFDPFHGVSLTCFPLVVVCQTTPSEVYRLCLLPQPQRIASGRFPLVLAIEPDSFRRVFHVKGTVNRLSGLRLRNSIIFSSPLMLGPILFFSVFPPPNLSELYRKTFALNLPTFSSVCLNISLPLVFEKVFRRNFPPFSTSF